MHIRVYLCGASAAMHYRCNCPPGVIYCLIFPYWTRISLDKMMEKFHKIRADGLGSIQSLAFMQVRYFHGP
jgi:hypothetical protein